ncbi:DUF1851 domain-containing protein [Streptomyces lichenis]|uniref:DUF1851 domain-containing protein n=1 Tax=Streptomyces lichenis TaxID=2306967 RepID=A0ABT0I7V0_9ACTN|nr:DUF1851 domain-containing protein [Streptomyces lichenis]MCK8677395.1 DUF1851 domain-containing protein [Streptomyces lichenis]
MTLEVLLRRFPVTDTVADDVPEEGDGLFGEVAGKTLAEGLLRFHTPASARVSYAACARLVAGIEGCYVPFAFDWSGRELLAGADDVVVVDPARGTALSTGLDPDGFLAAGVEDRLGAGAFREWREAYPGDPDPLAFDEVVGYRVPLLLGGEDAVANRERTGRRDYFDNCAAIARQVRRLPEGTVISTPA